MSRPRKEITEKDLRNILRMYPSKEDVAAYFECSPDTIENRCKEYGNCSFKEFREQCMVHTRLNLVRQALQQADSGNTTMLIFCLKNLCGWKDKIETESSGDIGINLKYQLPKKSDV